MGIFYDKIKVMKEIEGKKSDEVDVYTETGRTLLAGLRELNNFKTGAGVFSLILFMNIIPGIIGQYGWVASLAVLPVMIYFLIKKTLN